MKLKTFAGAERVSDASFQILKDADGLDRVRLKGTTGETNLLYLRLASSKTLLPLSERMYKEHWETLLL